MSLVSYTKAQFLGLTEQEAPLVLSEGSQVVLSDISLAISVQESSQRILEELGKFFKKSQVCLSPINPQHLFFEQVNPLTFKVLRTLTIHSANRSNWFFPPVNRFALRAIDVIFDCATIAKKTSYVWELKQKKIGVPKEVVESVSYKSHDGTNKPFGYMLTQTHTDGIVALHNGEIFYENYFDGQDANTPHLQFSVTKSLIGSLVAQLIVEGLIDPEKLIKDYIPELTESAFGDARVIEVLDMTTALKYSEEYADPESDVRKHMAAAGYLPQPADFPYPKTLRTFLATIKKEGEHYQLFRYVSANTEVLSWLIERAAKCPVNEIFADRIWSKIGPEHDAVIIADSAGVASWGGGFAATTRDMARIGLMMLRQGRAEQEQLLSPESFAFMRNRDTRAHYVKSKDALFPQEGWSFANQFWWTHNEHGAFMGIGIHGQLLYIDPKADVVVAKNSSHPEAEDLWIEHDAFIALHALIKKIVPEKLAAL